jgi:hypothetical protein
MVYLFIYPVVHLSPQMRMQLLRRSTRGLSASKHHPLSLTGVSAHLALRFLIAPQRITVTLSGSRARRFNISVPRSPPELVYGGLMQYQSSFRGDGVRARERTGLTRASPDRWEPFANRCRDMPPLDRREILASNIPSEIQTRVTAYEIPLIIRGTLPRLM